MKERNKGRNKDRNTERNKEGERRANCGLLTFDYDGEVILGLTRLVLEPQPVLAGLFGLDARHGERAVCVARVDVHVTLLGQQARAITRPCGTRGGHATEIHR